MPIEPKVMNCCFKVLFISLLVSFSISGHAQIEIIEKVLVPTLYIYLPTLSIIFTSYYNSNSQTYTKKLSRYIIKLLIKHLNQYFYLRIDLDDTMAVSVYQSFVINLLIFTGFRDIKAAYG